ncbi:dipeptide/oligopeptide/nickel ABC transporter ATP-binding protein [Alkalihalophilus marmarensis]|jgi:ABC-type dipeptide/oligopeptide/nickel transport system ATPase subunit|uniref:ABC transporter domain-containing protein n=1 Tax=Alkalihalophilus marmarensis DSM 21297 TaxID=1188261 RepID=U6SKK1_9BACI|nr:dipeptide/oligopeptide/nickel ABC transporter ATP-binding protein [Alkalihalophilus marmarensis]ERN51430.1 hypothetical protein A33I_01780 [Alkalihalophilus marmarensis DSM 21297]MCM3490357.1 dipeptide/oligopeptide/nickel ABC transporter ATP-binding protein [Alkalihalophilus marmarensis]
MILLELHQITKRYKKRSTNKVFWKDSLTFEAVKDVSFQLKEGECMGIIGESGSGKSTLAKLIMKLEKTTSGEIRFRSKPIETIKTFQLYQQIQLVIQDSNSVLHPNMNVFQIIQEPVRNFYRNDRLNWDESCNSLLKMVGLDESLWNLFPNQLSGGQKQRVCIARALAAKPSLIIFDESVASLDKEAQQFIINRLKELQLQEKVSYLFISHDYDFIREFCDRVAVMYKGEMVDLFNPKEVENILHPYTRMLLE